MPRRKVIKEVDRKSASELLRLILDELHRQLIEELQVDAEIRKLNARLIFHLIFYTLLYEDEISLRKMSHHSSTFQFWGLAGQACETLAHNSIRRRLLTISVEYFRKIYDHLYEKLAQQYNPRELKRQFNLKRLDSTMIHTFAYLLDGMKVGNTSKNKRQVKFSTEMQGEGLLHMHFFSDQQHVGDERTLREVILDRSPGSEDIVVFDSGLKSRATFVEFHQAGIQFVTRLNTNPVHEVIGPTDVRGFSHSKEQIAANLPGCAPVISDEMVYLSAARYQKVEQPFRLIKLDIGEEHPLCILTNITFFEPEVIGSLYRSRWDIEVLFRFLKQEFSLKHLVSHDHNAIEVMIYMTLITAMMVLLYKKQNQVHGYWRAKAQFLNDLMEEVLYMATSDPPTQQLIQERLLQKRSKLIRKIE